MSYVQSIRWWLIICLLFCSREQASARAILENRDSFVVSYASVGNEKDLSIDLFQESPPQFSDDYLGFVDGPNLYAYVKQNPWTAFDPEGLSETKGYYRDDSDIKRGGGTKLEAGENGSTLVKDGKVLAHHYNHCNVATGPWGGSSSSWEPADKYQLPGTSQPTSSAQSDSSLSQLKASVNTDIDPQRSLKAWGDAASTRLQGWVDTASKASVEVTTQVLTMGILSGFIRAAETGPELVNLASPQRTAHILTGDATGGGHLFPGAPGKTAFPQGWSGDQVMHHVSEIVTDPALKWVPQTGNGGWFTKAGNAARFSVEGVRDGVNIKVILEPAGEGIITAFPK